MKKFQVISLFPEMFSGVFEASMLWKAQQRGLVELTTIDLRQFGLGPRRTVDQALAQQYSQTDHGYIFICGRYEGYDERIMQVVDQALRVGDYVLTGGELPAMTIIDSIVRLIPGVLGGEMSAAIESFSDGQTLEFPQYTRPEVWQGMAVPEVLLSGHHGNIAAWRAEHSLPVDD